MGSPVGRAPGRCGLINRSSERIARADKASSKSRNMAFWAFSRLQAHDERLAAAPLYLHRGALERCAADGHVRLGNPNGDRFERKVT